MLKNSFWILSTTMTMPAAVPIPGEPRLMRWIMPAQNSTVEMGSAVKMYDTRTKVGTEPKKTIRNITKRLRGVKNAGLENCGRQGSGFWGRGVPIR